jgi:outer membrane protein OmpA-like peptidoglycan-associated protein
MTRPLLRLAPLLLVCANLPAFAADPPEVQTLNDRLHALDASPDLREMAAYERMQAVRAVQAAADAKRRDRENAQYVAERRVEIAETAARGDLVRRQANALDQDRNALLLQASRRDADRARQESERLRVQAQIQAEEAEQLRLAAEAEAQARSDAEAALTSAAGQQTAKISAARQRDAKLARQEAELVSGAKLPASKFETRGEVFTLAAAVYESGKTALTADGKSTASALAAYLEATPKAKARIVGFTEGDADGKRRAEQLRDAMAGAGVPKSRLTVAAQPKGTKAKAAEIVISE